MALGVDGVPAPRVVVKTTLLTLGTLGFTVCLTMLYQSMRSVMEIGGSCASGGPYEISRPCPTGVAWIMPVSIFGGLACLAIGALGIFRQGGPRPFVFAWSALFLALGWNFFEYGFDAPGGGTSVAWIVCGAVFAVMGAVPLFFLLSPSGIRMSLWGPKDDDDTGPVTTSSRIRRAIPIGPLPRPRVTTTPGAPRPPAAPAPPRPPASPAAPAAWPAPPASTAWPTTAPVAPFSTPVSAPAEPSPEPSAPADAPAAASGDLVERLARLADLHDRGALDDDEYERAKEAVLRGDGSSS